MNVALPILLLVFGGLSFWILTESTVKWYVKTACITIFCFFTIVFWTSIHTFLGWPADQEDMPQKVLLHWVIVKEPNKAKEYKGAIYVLLESAEEIKANKFARFFGYNDDSIKPRLFQLRYSRQMHEKLEGVMSKLKQGQPALGEFKKGEEGKAKMKGKKGEPKNDGDGSESQEQDFEFHELRPSDFQGKPID